MPSPPVETRCYVLAPDGSPPGAALAELIDRYGWTVESADDPLATLADVAGLERAESHRSAWGLRRRLDQALVVVPPEHAGGFGEIGALIDAVRRYLPDLPAWLYAAGTLSPLTPGGRARVHMNGASAVAPVRPVDAEPMPVPAAVDPEERPRSGSDSDSDSDSDQVTGAGSLGTDEIRMLLNRDPHDERTDDETGDRRAGAVTAPQPPPLPSAYAAPGVELRLSGPMAPEDAESAVDHPGAAPGEEPDDDPDAGPSRITSEEMRMLFETDPEAPARS